MTERAREGGGEKRRVETLESSVVLVQECPGLLVLGINTTLY